MPEFNPQNPYSSYIVSASAGCGKTYQLSRRFLFLVGAGADPSSILTVTFTKKAASEMKERILEDATDLIKNSELAKEYNEAIAKFRDHANLESEHPLEPAIDAKDVGKRILESSQRLRVSTIDSTYLDWYRKFPWEAKAPGEHLLPPLFDMATTAVNSELDERAWELTVKDLMEENKVLKKIASYSQIAPSIDHLKSVIFSLQRHDSFMWIAEKSSQSSPILEFSIDENSPSNGTEALNAIRGDLDLAKAYIGPNPRKNLEQAIGKGSLDEFVNTKIITKDYKLSGSSFKKLKSENPELFESISNFISNYFLTKSIRKLNELGPIYHDVFKVYITHRKRLKSELGVIDFNDPAIASFQLFTSPEASGATYLIHRNTQHLLLDEFQDTSFLQWEIFLE